MNHPAKVIPLFRRIRGRLLPHWGKAEIIGQKDASACNVVTKLDIEVEAFMREELRKLYPTIDFVGEEGGGNREAEKFWLMDPIDGTQHFVRGLPFCTSMIALIEDGVVTFSAIYDFLNDDMYWAEKKAGAFRNNERLRVSNRALSGAYICWEARLESEIDRHIFHRLRHDALLLQTISAGWEYTKVACGKLDGRICLNPFGVDYDYTPGSLLVSEAGGIVANLGSSQYSYKNLNFIAANPTIYRELTEGDKAVFPLKGEKN